MQQQQETTITTMPHWSLYHEKESCSWHFETLCPKQSLVRPLFWVTFLCCLCPREKRVLRKRTNAGDIMDWLLRCVCSPSYARSDLANSRCYSPIMPWWRLQACRDRANPHTINNLLPSNVRSSVTPRPCHIDLTIARSMRHGLGLRFSRKDLILD